MARMEESFECRFRAVYTVAPDPPHGWRVSGRRGLRGRGGFADREEAIAHGEALAAEHVVAQLRVHREDGSLERNEARFDEARCAEAALILAGYLAPLRDPIRALEHLHNGYEGENREITIGRDRVRLSVNLHEGSMWDEIHVSGSVWDEFFGPRIAEDRFVLLP